MFPNWISLHYTLFCKTRYNVGHSMAKCKICKCYFCCLSSSNFRRHMAIMHTQVFIHEEKMKTHHEWKYFKKMDDLYGRCTKHARCLMCDNVFKSDTHTLIRHAYTDHTLKDRNKYKIWKWPRKYCIAYSGYTVQCNFCKQTILLELSSNLNNHLKTKHPNIVTEVTCNTAKLSESTTNL